MKTLISFVAILGFASEALSQPVRPPIKVSVTKTAGGWQLTRDGKPFFIKGAGGQDFPESVASAGGNCLRTWGADDLEPLLNRAQALGLTVTVGIWLGQPRQGFRYDDDASVKRQFETVRNFIRRYKNHPAVLLWGIGNEMEGDGRDPRIWQAVNDLAKMAHAEDPDHPVMTVIAEIGGGKAEQFERSCPDVDILGINSYAGLPTLPERLAKAGFQKPYVITEFGPAGTWEVRKTPWGAPVEATSTEKARTYRSNYDKCIAGQIGKCLGSFAFLWGHKQEGTATWFGMWLRSGDRLGSAEAISAAWSGKPPTNHCPEISPIETDVAEKEIAPGTEHQAKITATDPDGDPLLVRWEVVAESTDRRSGGDPERAPLAQPDCIIASKGTALDFRAPRRPGAYRLFVYVYDGHGNAATANVPFLVRER